jgi:hypothetical protein
MAGAANRSPPTVARTIARVERLEGDRLDQAHLLPAADQRPKRVAAGEVLGPAGADQEEADRPFHPRQVVEELAGGRVGPLEVLDDEHDRRPSGELAEEREHRVEKAEAALGGVAGVDRRRLGGDARQQASELVAEGAELAPGRVRHGEVVADRLHEGEEAGRQLTLGAGAGQDLGAARFGLGDQLGHQPALADPGVPGDEDRPAGALSRLA